MWDTLYIYRAAGGTYLFSSSQDSDGLTFTKTFAFSDSSMTSRRATRGAQLASARFQRWQSAPPLHSVQNAVQFAFAFITNAGRFTQLQQIFAFCNIITLSEAAFSSAHETTCAEVTERAHNPCLTWRDRMIPETIIAMDGSWNQRRYAMHYVIDFVDTRTKKVIDFEIIEK
jgi:hypothetical protein